MLAETQGLVPIHVSCRAQYIHAIASHPWHSSEHTAFVLQTRSSNLSSVTLLSSFAFASMSSESLVSSAASTLIQGAKIADGSYMSSKGTLGRTMHRLQLDEMEQDADDSTDARIFCLAAQVPAVLMGRYAPDSLAPMLRLSPIRSIVAEEGEHIYWQTCLKGFPRALMHKLVQGLSDVSNVPIIVPKVDSTVPSSLWGPRMSTLEDRLHVFCAAQWTSNFPREDSHLVFDVPMLRATCIMVMDGHGSDQVT